MKVLQSCSADDLWRQAYDAVISAAMPKVQPSRAGDTSELLHVALQIQEPRQRWVVSRRPALNPAFGIAEIIWILAGSSSSEVLNFWNPKLPAFAGSGPTYAGAYGHRLRSHFGIDQIRRACDALGANPESRQVVLQLWDVCTDLPDEKGNPRNTDIPCNVAALLKVREGRLEWTQIMRSNDLYLGLPYNILQFTTLQEIMAGWLGVGTGSYHHWSDSLHLYRDVVNKVWKDESITLALNTDCLATTVVRGEELIRELYSRLVELTAPGISEVDIERIATMSNAPASYQNLLKVLSAESARRRRRYDLARELMVGCSNPQLVQVWTIWWERVQEHSRTQETIAV